MKGRTYGTEAARNVLLAAGACFAVAAQPALAQEGPPAVSAQAQSGSSVSPPPAEKPAAVPEGASGMKGFIDPQTGAIRPDPAPGTTPLELTPQERNAASTSHQDLVQVPSSEPGGGVKLDLRGRFQSPLMGTIDANGKLKMQHLGDMPGSGDNK
jgi:hypothetical protein